ncbi:MAG: hypothetical protein WCT49_04725 [Candidatus Paceibacterota bacterium]
MTEVTIETARDRLVQLFEEKEFCYWQCGEDAGSFGVTLSWPDMSKANLEIAQMIAVINTFNSEHLTAGIKLLNSQPTFSAGGAYVVYFEIKSS